MMMRGDKIPRPENYRHIRWALLFLIVPVWYCLLQVSTAEFHPVHIALDDHIPFISVFVIPYFLWYPLMVFTNVILMVRNSVDFLRGLALQMSGFIIGMLVQTLYPTCVDFRPADTGGGIFGYLTDLLYRIDRPINEIPSMHVYISLACALALTLANRSRISKGLKIIIWIITVLICLSTVFTKQHSAIDGVISIGLLALLAPIICILCTRRDRRGRFIRLP